MCVFPSVPLAPPDLVLNVGYCEMPGFDPYVTPNDGHRLNSPRIVVGPNTVDFFREAH